MRSSGGSRAVVVGIFTLLGVAIFVLMILTLGSQRKTFIDSIVVKSYFTNVNGLLEGNNVWYTGVKIGTVRTIKIVPGGTVEVKMNIEKTAVKFIHNDARAKLSSDGLIGNKIIEIYGGTEQAPIIKTEDILRTDTIVSPDQLMKTLSKNNDNVYAITSDLKTITGQLAGGKGTLGQLLTDETISDQIKELTKRLNNSADNIDQLSVVAREYTEKLKQPGTLANDLVTDTTVFSNLRQITQRLKSVSDSSQELINTLNTTGKTLQSGLESKESPAGLLLNNKEAAGKIQETLTNLQSASKKLDEDLEALQHNFLLRGFFKRKAKLEKANQRVVLDTLVGGH